MLKFDFEALSKLGLNPALASRALTLDVDETGALGLARIIEVHRETIDVHDGVAERSTRPLPRLTRALADDEDALAVGDWVLARVDSYGERWLEARVPPASHIVRRDGYGSRHAVVSNVDVALLLMGLDDDFNPRRIERYLALVHDDAILPVIVLTKADLFGDRAAGIAELRERVGAQVPIHAVDATDPSAAHALRAYCTRGTTLVMLGSSGTGKSTLTNTLLGGDIQDTGPVREHDSRGKHTTTSRSLHLLPGGACVIDTPGLRTLRPDGDAASLAGSFADIEALAARCRFADCRHDSEPGCAVRDGVGADRLRNYRKLAREMRRDTQTALDRRKQLAQWKVRSKAVRERMKWKRGLAG